MSHVLKIGLFFIYCTVLTSALPTSLVEEVISDDATIRKVKRAQAPLVNSEESQKPAAEYFVPTAVKRGANLKTDHLPLLSDWDQQRYRQANSLPSSLYTAVDDLEDKSLSEYEKGYRYGTNRDQLDEALENAILKSEIYGDPAAINQYRYYGNDDKKRRRRETRKNRLTNRFKRQAELSPEDILTILTLWENEREHSPNLYKSRQRFDTNYNSKLDEANDDSDSERNDGEWMDGPVYPQVVEQLSPVGANYYYDSKPQIFEKRGRWGGFAENKKKRFMVKKRNDPTRELRYLNGPSRNDFYTLSELLESQREPNLPLYQRYVL